MQLTIEQRHIDAANELVRKQRLPRIVCCPVALAAKEVFTPKWLSAGDTRLTLNRIGIITEFYTLSEELALEVCNWDNGGEFLPGSYEINFVGTDHD